MSLKERCGNGEWTCPTPTHVREGEGIHSPTSQIQSTHTYGMRAIAIAAPALAQTCRNHRNDELPKLRLPCSSQYARTEQPPLGNRAKGYQLLWLQIVEICDRFLGMRGGQKMNRLSFFNTSSQDAM